MSQVKKQLIECVPNFSEGKNPEIINGIANELSKKQGVQLLFVDPGIEANRTVYTLKGEPQKVVDSLIDAARFAKNHMDMRAHKGIHPRIGALDVCPLVPLNHISMEEVIEYSRQLAFRLGSELDIPVYMYAHSAQNPVRFELSNIRRGQYEGLKDKMASPDWQPDFGPNAFNPRFGACVVGARDFLIAYNINLETRDVALARHIAAMVRTSGYIDETTKKRMHSIHTLPALKAIGWYVESYKAAQVSTNITDFRKNSLKKAFETIRIAADSIDVAVSGSEIIGMVPYDAFISDNRRSIDRKPTPEDYQKMIRELHLNDKSRFDAERQILFY